MKAMTSLSSPGCGGGGRQRKKAAPVLDPSAPPFQPPSRQPAHRTFQYAVQPSPPAPPSLLRTQFPHQHDWLHHPRYISGYYYPLPMVQHPPWNLLKLPLLNPNPRPIALPIRGEGDRLLWSVKEDVAVKHPSAVPLYQEKKRCVRKIGCRKPRPGRCSIPTEGSKTSAQRKAVCGFPSGVTTLMIRNLPNIFRREDLLLILDKHCGEVNDDAETTASPEQWVRSEYDFVYLPFDFRQNMNLGYAFVNFTTPIGATRMSRAFHGFGWKGSSYNMRRGPLNSRKVCEINPAAIQGRAALEHHLGKREYPREEFQPVATLEKPCDGTGRPPLLLVGRLRDGDSRSGGSSYHCRNRSG